MTFLDHLNTAGEWSAPARAWYRLCARTLTEWYRAVTGTRLKKIYLTFAGNKCNIIYTFLFPAKHGYGVCDSRSRFTVGKHACIIFGTRLRLAAWWTALAGRRKEARNIARLPVDRLTPSRVLLADRIIIVIIFRAYVPLAIGLWISFVSECGTINWRLDATKRTQVPRVWWNRFFSRILFFFTRFVYRVSCLK